MHTNLIAATLAAHAPEPTTAECAACCHIGPCFDDGEAYICCDRIACVVRARAQIEQEAPRVSPLPPPCCPWCGSFDHAPGRCPQTAGGGPWEELAKLRADNARWRKLADDGARGMVNASREVARLDAENAALLQAHTLATQALEQYFEKYGALS